MADCQWLQGGLVPNLILYTSPRACSTACHIALQESGLPYEARIVRIREAEHLEPDFLAINSWGKVPALAIDDEVLTETHAILTYVALAAPGSSLIPASDALARARAHEWMNFLSSTVHIAFKPLFRPGTLIADERHYPQLREVGVKTLRKTLLEVDRRLAGKAFALGAEYSVVDPYLLVFWIWSQRNDVVPHVADMPNWRAQAERMFAREATWTCLNREGITEDNIRDP